MSTHSFGGYPPPDLPSHLSGKRGCGDSRTAGSLYLEVPTSPDGKPVEHFLFCPPWCPPIDVPAQGQMPFVKDGVVHLLCYVGKQFYSHVTDIIEEWRVLGVSELVSLQLATSQAPLNDSGSQTVLESLTPDSRLWFAHSRAFLWHYDYLRDFPFACPKGKAGHPEDAVNCVGAYWWDLDDGDPVEVPDDDFIPHADRLVNRTIPCGWTYSGRLRPEGLEGSYSTAIFARFPIIQLALVRGANGEHEPVRERLSKLNLHIPVLEVDE